MYELRYSGSFKKSYKLYKRRGYDMGLLQEAIRLLAEKGRLTPQYKPHILSGKYAGVWECHLSPDWLLLWMQDDTSLTLLFLETGTHADLF